MLSIQGIGISISQENLVGIIPDTPTIPESPFYQNLLNFNGIPIEFNGTSIIFTNN